MRASGGEKSFCRIRIQQASYSSHLPLEGQTPEELADLRVGRLGGRLATGPAALAQSHHPPLGDGQLQAHALDYLGVGLGVGHGPGGHRDVGGVLLALQVTHWEREGDWLVFKQAGKMVLHLRVSRLPPAEVLMVSVVLVSSSRTVGYAGCSRKSLLTSGSAGAT